MTNANRVTNRLINEKSPYLLQHAHNPVDWFAWGDEAFEKAKSEDKPVFLSIGYSTCHWCHVIERESFEDNEVAHVLNNSFVSVKVDREERPDIDHIYMTVCQALTGHGGWPLTIIMTPDKEPFFAGTYFPKEDKMGMRGLIGTLDVVAKAWKENRDSLLYAADQVLDAIKEPYDSVSGDFDKDIIHTAYSEFKYDFDSIYGGFGGAPKFPTAHNLLFLLRYWHATGSKSALEMVEKTLDSMYRGGIYDHIGYGFSRYSTDRKWLVPHFEKMLYDNALLAMAYCECYQATKNKKYSRVAQQIFTYVLRDMTSPEGAFFSAEDADSEGVEGKFYVWTPSEVKKALGDNAERFCKYYDITDKGNFEGKSIANLINSAISDEDMEFVQNCIHRLFEYRQKRVHPYKDDKILTSWNGLMIAALSIGGRVLDNEEYTLAAQKAVLFLLNNSVRKDGRLYASYRDGQVGSLGFTDDYAFLIWGLIELYQSTYNAYYLQKALSLNDDLIKYFWDSEKGGLFINGSDSEQLIIRPKEIYDGATPSGNSVSAYNFIRLARLCGKSELEYRANELLKAFNQNISAIPRAHAFSLISILFSMSEAKEVVVVADKTDSSAKQMLEFINSDFRPFVTSVYSDKQNNLEDIAPYLKEYGVIDGKPTAYICKNFSCMPPVNNINDFKSAIN